MSGIEDKILELYYHSLEALRNATQKNYATAFAYSYPAGRLKDIQARELIQNKKQDLDDFANHLNLQKTIETVKSIGRGKWLIEVFSDELVNCINGLQSLCREQRIDSCLSCITAAYEKCLYRMRDGVHSNTIRSLAFSHVSGSEFEYIIDRMSELRAGN